jgi:hypothetical protein
LISSIDREERKQAFCRGSEPGLERDRDRDGQQIEGGRSAGSRRPPRIDALKRRGADAAVADIRSFDIRERLVRGERNG